MTGIRKTQGKSLLGLALLLLALPFASLANSVAGVGFRPIAIHDPVGGGNMPGFVFYPSDTPNQATWRGPYELDASPGLPATAGSKPLVVISHGHGGSNLGHHDLATYLARHGFIVTSIEHPKDNFQDLSGTGTAAVLVGRPIQIKATIDALLGDPEWEIDANRVAVAGFSAGGYTALMIAGAVPRFEQFIDYCNLQPMDEEICGPITKAESKEKVRRDLIALQADLHTWGNPSDLRVKAAFVMAPLSLLFDGPGLSRIEASIFLYYAQDDRVLLPEYNALRITPLLNKRTVTRMIASAGHYVFLSPCSPALARIASTICTDPPGVDRIAQHRRLNADALAFFENALRMPKRSASP